MRIAMLATASAIAFAFTIGSVSAADEMTATKTIKQFTTLNSVKAIQMSAGELSAVKGMDHHFTVTNPRTGNVTTHNTDQHQDAIGTGGKGANFVDLGFVNMAGNPILVAPSYHGLRNACGNGVIDGPGFLC